MRAKSAVIYGWMVGRCGVGGNNYDLKAIYPPMKNTRAYRSLYFSWGVCAWDNCPGSFALRTRKKSLMNSPISDFLSYIIDNTFSAAPAKERWKSTRGSPRCARLPMSDFKCYI